MSPIERHGGVNYAMQGSVSVVILCASRRPVGAMSAGASRGAAGAGPPVLLVHVEECELEPRATDASLRSPPTDTKNAYQLTNINLDIFNLGESLFPRTKRNLSSGQPTVNDRTRNLSSLRWHEYNIKDKYKVHNKNKNTDIDAVQLGLNINIRKEYTEKTSPNDNNAQAEKSTQSGFMTQIRSSRVQRRHSYPVLRSDHINWPLPQTEFAFFQRLLLLTDEHLESPFIDSSGIYDKIIEAAEEEFQAKRTRLDYTKIDFHLYEWSNNASTTWCHAAVLTTTSTRSLDLTDEWVTTAELLNVTVSLDSWSAAAAGAAAGASSAAALSGAAAGGALALATGAALLLRWAATRRRRRRRRRDAVLAPIDFTFPVDERRRVGEGMETMLSCWLQQLHEFGGPELERPDLLKQPPCVAPHAPSAPSSTCSVNRVAVDRRIRYKVLTSPISIVCVACQ